METENRIGNAVYPNHYDVGWHITGTAGVFGAAAAAGKCFNPGRAASNGLFAALLASKNYTSSEGMIEAKRGWANTISTKQDFREITEGLGQRYESALNTYKPFVWHRDPSCHRCGDPAAQPKQADRGSDRPDRFESAPAGA